MFTSSFSRVTELALGDGFWFSSLFLVMSLLRFDTAIVLEQTNLFNHTREIIIKSPCRLPPHFLVLFDIGKSSIFCSFQKRVKDDGSIIHMHLLTHGYLKVQIKIKIKILQINFILKSSQWQTYLGVM